MSSSEPARRRGRRPAGEDVRPEILAAARAEFAERGFDGASVRAIARRAGVDPGTVRHHFDGKPALFFAAVVPDGIDPPVLVARLVAAEPEQRAPLLLHTLLEIWDTPEGAMRLQLALGAANASDSGVREFVAVLQRTVYDALAASLDVDHAAMRVSLIATQLVGLLMARLVMRLEPVASMPREHVVALIAPTLARYLDGPLDVGG